MGVSKTFDQFQINIKMSNPSQEAPASSKSPNKDLKDMDVLCTFKIKIQCQNLDYGYIKDQWPYSNQYQDAKHGQSPPASSKAPNEDLKDADVLCTCKIKAGSQNLDLGCIKDQWPYPSQDQDAQPQSGTSSVPQSPKWRLKVHGWAKGSFPAHTVPFSEK